MTWDGKKNKPQTTRVKWNHWPEASRKSPEKSWEVLHPLPFTFYLF